MKQYSIKQFARMSNGKLKAHLNRQTLALLAEGISEKAIEQFFLTAAEITLRINEGRLSPGSSEPASASR